MRIISGLSAYDGEAALPGGLREDWILWFPPRTWVGTAWDLGDAILIAAWRAG